MVRQVSGLLATQITNLSEARIIGTASGTDDVDYLKSLRVDELIDFAQERFEDTICSVDAVVDLAGGYTLHDLMLC
jgi:NADPH-dependent curcumin reductase CurA